MLEATPPLLGVTAPKSACLPVLQYAFHFAGSVQACAMDSTHINFGVAEREVRARKYIRHMI